MSRKLFLQIVALIAIGFAMYFVVLTIRDWQAKADYNARMEQIKADSDNRLRDLQTGLRNSL